MKAALCLIAAAYSLAAQQDSAPKGLINAKVDTRPVSGNLESEFHSLLTSQPQPAWIGYSVPTVRTNNIGCQYSNGDNWNGPGVVHLEPPDHAIILFRVESNALDRIRTLSPDCEIDAGGVPFHWLTGVQPSQSVALLVSLAKEPDASRNGAISAIAMHGDPAADQALDRFLAPDQPQQLRLRVVSWLGSERGKPGFEKLKTLIASDPDERIRERAVQALASVKDPAAIDLEISIARSNADSRLRTQAISELGHKSNAKTIAVIKQIVESDPDTQVQRRAVSALQSLPDGEGIPMLIEVVKTTKSPELRKMAMNSLQSSRDPRALAFFESVLK
jgi:hypothetical protein